MTSFTTVLFDLDGTLLDTIEDLADSWNATLARFGLPQHEVEAYKYFVGDGMETLARRVLPEGRQDLLEKYVEAGREEYEKRWANKSRPYDGIPELLDALTKRNMTLVVLSNKPHDFTVKVIATLLPHWSFKHVVGAKPDVPKKPDPRAAIDIASHLDVAPHTVLYIGDTNTDMQTAVAAGMYPVGVLWGFREADELTGAGAKMLIKHPMELIEVIDGSSN